MNWTKGHLRLEFEDQMDRHELFDELDACDRRWRSKYLTLTAAAEACNARQLLQDYLKTDQGRLYLEAVHSVPPYLQDILREQELARSGSLPFGLDTIGTTKI